MYPGCQEAATEAAAGSCFKVGAAGKRAAGRALAVVFGRVRNPRAASRCLRLCRLLLGTGMGYDRNKKYHLPPGG